MRYRGADYQRDCVFPALCCSDQDRIACALAFKFCFTILARVLRIRNRRIFHTLEKEIAIFETTLDLPCGSENYL